MLCLKKIIGFVKDLFDMSAYLCVTFLKITNLIQFGTP